MTTIPNRTEIAIRLSQEDFDFLYGLHDLFGNEDEYFDPELWMKRTIREGVKQLRERMKGQLSDCVLKTDAFETVEEALMARCER